MTDVTSRTATNKIYLSGTQPNGIYETTTCGTVDTAEVNEVRYITLGTWLEDDGSGRTSAHGGRDSMVANMLEEEVIDGEIFFHRDDWVDDMECKYMTSNAICVAFVETKRKKSVEKELVAREA